MIGDAREQRADRVGVVTALQRVLTRLPFVGDVVELVARCDRRLGSAEQHAQALAEHALASGDVDDTRVAGLAVEHALHDELACEQQTRDREQRADVAKGERARQWIAQRKASVRDPNAEKLRSGFPRATIRVWLIARVSRRERCRSWAGTAANHAVVRPLTRRSSS